MLSADVFPAFGSPRRIVVVVFVEEKKEEEAAADGISFAAVVVVDLFCVLCSVFCKYRHSPNAAKSSSSSRGDQRVSVVLVFERRLERQNNRSESIGAGWLAGWPSLVWFGFGTAAASEQF